jgi:hypothetical protein
MLNLFRIRLCQKFTPIYLLPKKYRVKVSDPFFQLKQLYLALKIVGYGINEAIDLPLMGFIFPLKIIFPLHFLRVFMQMCRKLINR